jgi:hypothetical protein
VVEKLDKVVAGDDARGDDISKGGHLVVGRKREGRDLSKSDGPGDGSGGVR